MRTVARLTAAHLDTMPGPAIRRVDASPPARLICRRRSLVLIVVFACAVTPSRALAGPRDVAATHAAVTASYMFARASIANISVAQSKIESFKHRLATECPGAGAGTPESEASQPMSQEVAAALWSIAYGSLAHPIEAFARALGSLHWTSARVNQAAHRLTANLIALATIPLPDLCGDVRAWAAGAFATVPRQVIELDRHVEPLEVPEIPWKLLAPYMRAADTTRLAYIKRAETKLAEFEFMVGQKDWYQVLETIGLPP